MKPVFFLFQIFQLQVQTGLTTHYRLISLSAVWELEKSGTLQRTDAPLIFWDPKFLEGHVPARVHHYFLLEVFSINSQDLINLRVEKLLHQLQTSDPLTGSEPSPAPSVLSQWLLGVKDNSDACKQPSPILPLLHEYILYKFL